MSAFFLLFFFFFCEGCGIFEAFGTQFTKLPNDLEKLERIKEKISEKFLGKKQKLERIEIPEREKVWREGD